VPRVNAEESIRRAWEYLLERARDRRPFSVADLAAAADWSMDNTETNLSKRLSDVVYKTLGNRHELNASPEILRVRYSDFVDLFRQKQRLFTDYTLEHAESVLQYEFFMPLAREDRLREALDNLFYLDTIEQRITEVGLDAIREGLNIDADVTDDEAKQLVIEFIQGMIWGYSLSLVNGRFRHVNTLQTREVVARRSRAEGPYLVDETTAVVRFILPVDVEEVTGQRDMFAPRPISQDTQHRAAQVRWIFLYFFAEAVTRVVKKEDEIWLLESGMKSKLYKWVRQGG